MSEDLMRSYYAAYNAESPERLAAMLAPDVTLVSATGTLEGREAYLETYRTMIGLFVDRMEPVRITCDGQIATAEIVDTLTARADIPDFMGQRLAAGQTITLNLTGRYAIADGTICRIEIAAAGM